MNAAIGPSGYRYHDAQESHAHAYLLPAISRELETLRARLVEPKLFDLDCGNGSVGASLSQMEWQVTGVDPSADGIAHARLAYPNLALFEGSAYDPLCATYGSFPAVISLEVVEHVYSPRQYAKTLFDLVDPGGTAIVSTPFHRYIKNLSLALTNRMDSRFTMLWDDGHIKFWSKRTLKALLSEVGFTEISFRMAGRIPPLAKSMIAIARRPGL